MTHKWDHRCYHVPALERVLFIKRTKGAKRPAHGTLLVMYLRCRFVFCTPSRAIARYLRGDIRETPRRLLGACMLGLPPSYVLESARVGTKGDLAKLPVLLALLYFFIVMPVGILLPTWLAGEPDGALFPPFVG